MQNKIFTFKQFQVQQCDQVFEIGTDALLLGSLTELSDQVHSILEVGAGTGVVSLMFAQRSKAMITAVDVNEYAVKCANLNFKNSKFSNQLFAQQLNVKDIKGNIQYDLIVSNPPFHESNKTLSIHRDLARNHANVFLNVFFSSLKEVIKSNGVVVVVIPRALRIDYVTTSLEEGFYLQKECHVFTGNGVSKRVILTFGLDKTVMYKQSEFILRDQSNNYSVMYKQLMKGYLLS